MNSDYSYHFFQDSISAGYGNSIIAGNYDFHLHNNYEIYLLLKGDMDYYVEHSCYRLKRGSLMIFNSHEIHKATNLTKEPHQRLVLHFDSHFVQKLSTSRTDLLACFHNRDLGIGNASQLSETQIQEYTQLVESLIAIQKNKGYGGDILSTTYLIQILVMVNDIYSKMNLTIPNTVSSVLTPILLYIDEHITENLSLDKIADALSLSKFYLSHLFESKTGSSVYQYILMKRIAIAKQCLSTGKNVTETCQLAGFNDYANFIRTFKKITGIPPGKYGRMHS